MCTMRALNLPGNQMSFSEIGNISPNNARFSTTVSIYIYDYCDIAGLSVVTKYSTLKHKQTKDFQLYCIG